MAATTSKTSPYPPQILAGLVSASPATQDYARHSANSTLLFHFQLTGSPFCLQIVAKDYRMS